MHSEVFDHVTKVKKLFPEFFLEKKVLEIGSLDINGSVRPFFIACEYTGLDLGEGKGVDVICPIAEYIFPEEFDVVISTECGEHSRTWHQDLIQMYNNLKPNGLLIYTAAGPNRHEHGTSRTTPGDAPFTNDWYRNIDIADFRNALPSDLFSIQELKLVRGDCDITFYGIKK